MKGIFIFCTRLWAFLIEIPVIFLLLFAMNFNDEVTTPLKLYPLIVFCFLLIGFIFIYFFRGIYLSFEEVRMMGLFSSRDRALISKDKELLITVRKFGKVKIELFGTNEKPTLEWLREDETTSKINLFRENAVGGKGSVKKILKLFEIPAENFGEILGSEEFTTEDAKIKLSAATVNEERQISIFFKETI